VPHRSLALHVGKAARRQSDFLKYKNDAGLYADFHSNRHTFITNLEHVGVSPRKAQTLARHCDIRLTMGVYTHLGLHDQTAAIESLPPPPELRPSGKSNGNGQAGGNGATPKGANGQGHDKAPLDALWAQLPEDVKARLLARAGPGSDPTAGQSGSHGSAPPAFRAGLAWPTPKSTCRQRSAPIPPSSAARSPHGAPPRLPSASLADSPTGIHNAAHSER